MNIAAGKTAYQSATSNDAPASRAVDGNRNGQWDGMSCSHTPQMDNPYWGVDLEKTYIIQTVSMLHREILETFMFIIWEPWNYIIIIY